MIRSELLERIIDYCSKIESVKRDQLGSRDLFEKNELVRDALSFYLYGDADTAAENFSQE